MDIYILGWLNGYALTICAKRSPAPCTTVQKDSVLSPFQSSIYAAACAQSERSIHGQVMDESGAPISVATVTGFLTDRVRAMKTDDFGLFAFTGLPQGPFFLEAPATGFFSESIPVVEDIKKPLSIKLHVGYGSQCHPQNELMHPSAVYEERSTASGAQVTGTMFNILARPYTVHGYTSTASGAEKSVQYQVFEAEPNAPLSEAALVLERAKLDSWSPTDRPDALRTPAMHGRNFQYIPVARVISDEQGKFQFTDLEPGWYRLKAEHDGHWAAEAKFWVARDDITKVSPILMHPKSGVVNESGDQVFVQCYNW
jgi:protocatechuate 3,4-dioxygenase beta subunit